MESPRQTVELERLKNIAVHRNPGENLYLRRHQVPCQWGVVHHCEVAANVSFSAPTESPEHIPAREFHMEHWKDSRIYDSQEGLPHSLKTSNMIELNLQTTGWSLWMVEYYVARFLHTHIKSQQTSAIRAPGNSLSGEDFLASFGGYTRLWVRESEELLSMMRGNLLNVFHPGTGAVHSVRNINWIWLLQSLPSLTKHNKLRRYILLHFLGYIIYFFLADVNIPSLGTKCPWQRFLGNSRGWLSKIDSDSV